MSPNLLIHKGKGKKVCHRSCKSQNYPRQCSQTHIDSIITNLVIKPKIGRSSNPISPSRTFEEEGPTLESNMR